MEELLIKYRRELHRIPEIGFELPKTCAYVKDALAGAGAEVFSPCPGALCAFFNAGQNESVAFRADMDALPGQERGTAPYASRHAGAMHACGHDGHSAILLGLAQRLGGRALPRNVLLIFQPAEESGAGARRVCESGVLEKYGVKRIFGLHLWPGLPVGRLCARPGPMMAQANEIDFDFCGKAAHIARAEEGRDALAAGLHCLAEAEKIKPRPALAREPWLLAFGKFSGGAARNALAAKARAEGSLRCFSQEMFEDIRGQLNALAERTAQSSGCAVRLHIAEGYPPVVNPEGLYEEVAAKLGADTPALLPAPQMVAEDFSFYQQRLPGLFFFLGCGEGPALHADDFDFDEAALAKGLAVWERLAGLP